ncbi:MAG: hypothetical protein GXX85_10800 [Ignavibacteria bacterium]|nr:hypothetical protein [Ignavibacteria bacterium]
MKPLICVYCEGNDTKVSVVSSEGSEIRVLKTISLSGKVTGKGDFDSGASVDLDGLSGDISFEKGDSGALTSTDSSDVSLLAAGLNEFKLPMCEFALVVSEPVLNYHIFEGVTSDEKKKTIEIICNDLKSSKGIIVDPESIDYTELIDKSLLTGFIEHDIQAFNLIQSLASYHGKRFYKINTIKSADIALAHYVAKNNEFFPEDFSLVLYTAKEYSKLIFLEGSKLKHLGPTLDIGTQNIHTYDVYFSKILLEMENGGVPRLDNIVICGEDNSENLILSFYGAFPEANVIELGFDKLKLSALNDDDKSTVSAFTIPVAAAVEYFDEQANTVKGFNILPKYIKENQKPFQLGWHTIVVMALLPLVVLFLTMKYLNNSQEISDLERELNIKKQEKIRNQELLSQIDEVNQKIENFGKTQSILDSASAGAEVWSKTAERIASFMERRRNFWITKLETSGKDINIDGYSQSRSVLTEFADYNSSSLLKSILYEPLREESAYAFSLNFKLTNDSVD